MGKLLCWLDYHKPGLFKGYRMSRGTIVYQLRCQRCGAMGLRRWRR